MMDIFLKFNNRSIQDRQIDTLIGLSKGLVADDSVNQSEAEFLLTWLEQNQYASNPIIINLLNKISGMLDDGVLDSEESSELLSCLRLISGEKSELGEVAKSSKLPICQPEPIINFEGKSFLFTGTCAFGVRRECEAEVSKLGGKVIKNVTQKLDYLILGTYVTNSWAHENFGRKIDKAMEYRESGLPLHIITEKHWLEQSNL